MLAITSKSSFKKRYINTLFRYSLTYVLVTLAVLLFLNIYCARSSQEFFYKSKEAYLAERCKLAAAAIHEAEVFNTRAVMEAVSPLNVLKSGPVIVTDRSGIPIYVSGTVAAIGQKPDIVEITKALSGLDVFTWNFSEGVMESRYAQPLYSYGSLIGCIYMAEYDREQGALLQALQQNILIVTLVIELAVILFSIFFTDKFARRLRKIRSSMRIIRSGNYAHKVSMGGKDELTLLGDEFDTLTERLQESEEQRRQFVSDASHELKTPLASIKLLSDSILQNEMEMTTVREFVGDIGHEADRLNRMSMKLLSLSRLDSQEIAECEIVDMAAAVEHATRILSALATKENVRVIHDFKDACPVLILEDDLHQIVFNLLENGIKYNKPGGTLTVSLYRDDDSAVMKVTDTGVGIPEDALPHIFKRFYRVDKARSRKTGGSGLGLSIVHSIVEQNNGSIAISSEIGVGTTFTVTFPLFDTENIVP